uniref:EFR1 family ferrodoxin n=1 Tax=Prevotella sp. GTC17260 TaxID=3236796 RepID=A0AB33J7I8_9BACT
MIFYFSATGNSRWLARELGQATGEDLISISESSSPDCYTLKKDERIGFIFPIHGWRPPKIMLDFIAKLSFQGDNGQHYCYAAMTAGDDIGRSVDYLNKALGQIGLHTHAAFSLKMPNTYVGLPFMDTDKPHIVQAKKQNSEELLRKYIPRILNREHDIVPIHNSHWPRINSDILGSLFVKRLLTDKPFYVDESRCVKCGICADVCPTDNIKGGLGFQPTWLHADKCITCFACYHYCPHHAIEYGNKTQHKGQYRYK